MEARWLGSFCVAIPSPCCFLRRGRLRGKKYTVIPRMKLILDGIPKISPLFVSVYPSFQETAYCKSLVIYQVKDTVPYTQNTRLMLIQGQPKYFTTKQFAI